MHKSCFTIKNKVNNIKHFLNRRYLDLFCFIRLFSIFTSFFQVNFAIKTKKKENILNIKNSLKMLSDTKNDSNKKKIAKVITVVIINSYLYFISIRNGDKKKCSGKIKDKNDNDNTSIKESEDLKSTKTQSVPVRKYHELIGNKGEKLKNNHDFILIPSDKKQREFDIQKNRDKKEIQDDELVKVINYFYDSIDHVKNPDSKKRGSEKKESLLLDLIIATTSTGNQFPLENFFSQNIFPTDINKLCEEFDIDTKLSRHEKEKRLKSILSDEITEKKMQQISYIFTIAYMISQICSKFNFSNSKNDSFNIDDNISFSNFVNNSLSGAEVFGDAVKSISKAILPDFKKDRNTNENVYRLQTSPAFQRAYAALNTENGSIVHTLELVYHDFFGININDTTSNSQKFNKICKQITLIGLIINNVHEIMKTMKEKIYEKDSNQKIKFILKESISFLKEDRNKLIVNNILKNSIGDYKNKNESREIDEELENTKINCIEILTLFFNIFSEEQLQYYSGKKNFENNIRSKKYVTNVLKNYLHRLVSTL